MLVWASAEKTSVSTQRMEESLCNLEAAGQCGFADKSGILIEPHPFQRRAAETHESILNARRFSARDLKSHCREKLFGFLEHLHDLMRQGV
jgi:hypothetical protein